ncbi:MAG: hypothetical protein VKQ33_09970 [Candidatus Sericytochromatia bacterium]|nr:hypothetical protein [Candidatus Sericytochromatia bacterium]
MTTPLPTPAGPLLLVNPGTHPAEVVVWVAGRTMRVRLFPVPDPAAFPPGPARDVVVAINAQRAEVLESWGAVAASGEPFTRARAVRVMPLAGGRWCFELAGGVAVAVPVAFVPGLSQTRLSNPVAIEGGCWWLWPDVPVAVDVGALLAALGEGAERVRPLVVRPLLPEAPATPPPGVAEPAAAAAPAAAVEPPQGDQAPPPRDAGSVVPQPPPEAEPEAAQAAAAPAAPTEGGASGPANLEAPPVNPEAAPGGTPVAPPEPRAQASQAASAEAIDRRTRIHTASVQGLILLNGDFVTEEEYARINDEQNQRKGAGQTAALGQVAVEMGFVTPEQLRFVMALARRLTPRGNEPKSLALFLLEHNVIRPSALNAALDRVEASGAALEAVLVEMNLIQGAALRTFVDIHTRFSSRA